MSEWRRPTFPPTILSRNIYSSMSSLYWFFILIWRRSIGSALRFIICSPSTIDFSLLLLLGVFSVCYLFKLASKNFLGTYRFSIICELPSISLLRCFVLSSSLSCGLVLQRTILFKFEIYRPCFECIRIFSDPWKTIFSSLFWALSTHFFFIFNLNLKF